MILFYDVFDDSFVQMAFIWTAWKLIQIQQVGTVAEYYENDKIQQE
jgi:hypothetical protein